MRRLRPFKVISNQCISLSIYIAIAQAFYTLIYPASNGKVNPIVDRKSLVGEIRVLLCSGRENSVPIDIQRMFSPKIHHVSIKVSSSFTITHQVVGKGSRVILNMTFDVASKRVFPQPLIASDVLKVAPFKRICSFIIPRLQAW